jgi:hypothetical protein
MFLNASSNSGKLKKVVYICATTFLGLMLSFIAHGLIEMAYLRWAADRVILVPFYGGCALPPALQALIWLTGGIGGFMLGRFWWRKVYVEKIWARRIKISKRWI